MLKKLGSNVKKLGEDVQVLLIALRDPRTPWLARGIIALVAAYAVSPIDLIPDFIPVLGYLDDLILVPLGIALAIRLIPPQVLADSRTVAGQPGGAGRGLKIIGAGIIVLIWILTIIVFASLIYHLLKEKL